MGKHNMQKQLIICDDRNPETGVAILHGYINDNIHLEEYQEAMNWHGVFMGP